MKTLLLIEDDKTQIQALQKGLAKLCTSCNLLVANTVGEAQEICKKQTPTLIVLDIMLPGGKNGFDFIEQIEPNSELAQVPILVATNLDSEEKVSQMLGVKEYFIKAQTPLDVLVNKIAQYLL